MAGAQGSPLAYRESNLSIPWYPALLAPSHVSILFLNILTLLAPTQSADNLFHSFTVLCEHGNCLISSLHCFFANVIPCPLVLISSLIEKDILSIFSYTFNI